MRVFVTACALVVASLLPSAATAQERPQRGETEEKEAVSGPRVVEVEITERGLIPSVIKLHVDELIELRLSRKSAGACAKLEIPARDEVIPLEEGKQVTHHFRGHEAGRYPFGCAAYTGYFVVE